MHRSAHFTRRAILGHRVAVRILHHENSGTELLLSMMTSSDEPPWQVENQQQIPILLSVSDYDTHGNYLACVETAYDSLRHIGARMANTIRYYSSLIGCTPETPDT